MIRSKCLVRMSGMFVCAWLLSAGAVHAAFTSLAYQGKLTDAAGQPINGQVRMVFRIWNDTLSRLDWVETQAVVNVQSGLFNVRLGTTIPLPYHTFIQDYDTQFSLGIQVGNDAEMTPRIPFLSVFSANMAGWASHAASATHAYTADRSVNELWTPGANSNIWRINGQVGIGHAPEDGFKFDVKNPMGPVGMRLLGGHNTRFVIDSTAWPYMPEIQFHQYGTFLASIGFDKVATNLFLYHDGSVVVHKGRLGIGTLTPTNSLEVNGTVRVTGQARGTYPRPDYDSGWQTYTPGQVRTFTHNIGGTRDNYVVDLQARNDGGNPNNRGEGSMEYLQESGSSIVRRYKGYDYTGLTTSSITVTRRPDDNYNNELRVRIWRYN